MNNFMVSDRFSFFELTKTGNYELLEQNRLEAKIYLPTARALAWGILEVLRESRPLFVNSGFRGEALNSITPGSSPKSQHRLFQAADICRPAEKCAEVFDEIIAIMLEKKVPFGQLIYEKVDGRFGIKEWIHVSLGPGFRDPEKCGQILKRDNDTWTQLQKVDCLSWKMLQPGWTALKKG
jgi:hypothetical protein